MAVARRRHVFSITDGKKQVGTVIIHSNHLLSADAESFNDQMKIAIENMVTGTVSDWGYYTARGQDSSAPAVNSDRQEKGAFTLEDADTFAMLVSIPTFNEGLILAGTDLINLAAPAVDTFVDLMIAEACTERAISLVSVQKAKEVFK